MTRKLRNTNYLFLCPQRRTAVNSFSLRTKLIAGGILFPALLLLALLSVSTPMKNPGPRFGRR